MHQKKVRCFSINIQISLMQSEDNKTQDKNEELTLIHK